MIRISSVTSPVMIGLLLCTTVMTAQAATLTGVVRNKTLDRVEAGVSVQLVHHSAQTAEVLNDTTDANGAFRFEISGEPSADVPMMLSAEYNDVSYRSDRVTDLNAPVEIAVYESTGSDAAIEMVSHHLIIDAEGRQATQILIFQNTGDRTFRTGTGHGHGLEVPLPVGVTDVQSEIPGVHSHGPTLVDSRPVPPGRMQLAFTTPIPADGRFTQTLKYATPSIDAFISPADFQVTESSMSDLGSVNMGERQFRRLLSENVPAGGQVSFRLAFTSPVSTGSGEDVFDGAGKGPWALGGLAVGALLALAYLKMGSKSAVTVEEGEDLGPELRRTALIQQIANLDDRYERKDLGKEDYESRREALKAEVVDLTKATTG